MNQKRSINFQKFLRGYIAAMIFVGLDEDASQNEDDFSEELKSQTENDCEKFFAQNEKTLMRAVSTIGYDFENAGMDYFYTRNGHGVGFWDRNLGETGIVLSKASKAAGEHNIYVGDDGAIYGLKTKLLATEESSMEEESLSLTPMS